MKPRIKYVPVTYFYGFPCAPIFVCSSDIASGLGRTMKGAYDDWAKDLPKSVIGRINRRFWFWLFDL